jgi:GNAT superfamily N-acetyltransferase
MKNNDDIVIRKMSQTDIVHIVETFKVWNKKQEQYEHYFEELKKGTRDILVAWHATRVVGYVTILWEPRYDVYKKDRVPEIVDLNVIVSFQRHGIGSRLIAQAEQLIVEKGYSHAGISVKQSPEYIPARNLYQKLQYQLLLKNTSESLIFLIKTL